MVKISEVVSYLHSFAPPALAESYDNVGLLIGDKEQEIKKILVTLDTDETVVQEAVEAGANLIVSHHPLIFKPLRRIVKEDAVSRTTVSLIRNDIALFAMHTNFDSVRAGLCDLFLDKIGETKGRMPIEGEGEDGAGRIAELEKAVETKTLLEKIKAEFHLPAVRYVGDENKQIFRIAVCNGGGADFVYQAKAMGADCYISGDIKYQHARYAHENGMVLMEVPHYSAEWIFIDYAADILQKQFTKDVEILKAKTNKDIWKQYI